MKVGVPKETFPGETRAAIVPVSVTKLVKKEIQVAVESGLGLQAGFTDEDYKEAGALIAPRDQILAHSDVILRVRKPDDDDVKLLKKGSVHISFLDPFNEAALIESLCTAEVHAVSMEMIPRTTYAQKMDALSSQANLAGYVAVILAAERLNRILPMMTTPAGTLQPARVFIVGVGVAGLQAIATAKRLGARVEAFDVRPEVEEQVQSLGAKFVKIDVGQTESTADGYAKEMTPEQYQKQKEGMAEVCGNSDIVITTAQLFGRPAPVLLEEWMVDAMRPGSIVVDLAVETGGNVAGSKLNEEVDINGVTILGLGNLPGRVAAHASQMYSTNITNLLMDYYDDESKAFNFDLDDEILKGCLITHNGKVINERILEFSK